jgi:hypothetical protein
MAGDHYREQNKNITQWITVASAITSRSRSALRSPEAAPCYVGS